ncbi:MAG TPA: hypothetical protein VG713_09865, partial [Pirellulales bacterium]|nr:hypothetical protein [Pirellulales bacterium]
MSGELWLWLGQIKIASRAIPVRFDASAIAALASSSVTFTRSIPTMAKVWSPLWATRVFANSGS